MNKLTFLAVILLAHVACGEYYYESTTECESTTLPNPTTPECTTEFESTTLPNPTTPCESESVTEPACPESSESGSNDVELDAKNKNINVNRIRIGDDGKVKTCSEEESTTVCDDADTDPEHSRQCRLYLPFDKANAENFFADTADTEVKDYSGNDHTINMRGTWHLENNTAKTAHGRGSLYLSHGEMNIPDLNDIFQCGRQTTMCFWVRCDETEENGCKHGTIYSNRDEQDCDASSMSKKFSMVIEIIENEDSLQLPGLRVRAGFKHHKPTIHDFIPTNEDRNFGYEGLPFEFQQFCVMYDGQNVTVTNNANWKKTHIGRQGRLRKTGNPAIFGNDAKGGPLKGWLDEIIVCDRVLTWVEINAHFAGRIAMENQGMIPADTELYDYRTLSPGDPGDPACGHNRYWKGDSPRTDIFGIVGGREVEDYEFPWTVLFQTTNFYYHCHGTLTSDRHAVTSGLCCLRMQEDGLSNVRAYFGVTSTGLSGSIQTPPITSSEEFPNPMAGGYIDWANIENIWIHPDYDEAIYDNFNNETVNRTRSARYFSSEHNICKVKFDKDIDIYTNWGIVQVCPPSCSSDTSNNCQVGSGHPGLMTGFGQQAYNEWDWSFMSNKGRVVTIPRISDGACLTSLNRWYPTEDWFSPEEVNMHDNFCAGYVNKGTNSDACYGDDGTGFLCAQSGKFTLEGILSGWDCSSTPGSPSQFTDLCAEDNREFLEGDNSFDGPDIWMNYEV